MTKHERDAYWRLKQEIYSSMPASAWQPPFFCLSDKSSGWSVGVGPSDKDRKWHDPIKLMKESLNDGWDNDEMLRAIRGVRSLLAEMEKQWKQFK